MKRKILSLLMALSMVSSTANAVAPVGPVVLAGLKSSMALKVFAALTAAGATVGGTGYYFLSKPFYQKLILLNCDTCRKGTLAAWNYVYDNYPEWADWIFRNKIAMG